jgi:hypothetical protein
VFQGMEGEGAAEGERRDAEQSIAGVHRAAAI